MKNYNITHQQENKERNQSPKEIKRCKLKSWKLTHFITFGNITPSDFYDEVYIPAIKCFSCFKVFNNKIKNDTKCLDHIHLPLFCNVRGVICNECNSQDKWLYRAHPKSFYSSPFYKQQHDLYIMEKKREYTIQNHLDLD